MTKTKPVRMSTRRAAAVIGSRFYNGSACKRCGSKKRYVLSACCVACQLDAARRQRAEFIRMREIAIAALEGK